MIVRTTLLVKNAWRYLTEWKQLGIKPSDLVLEIGGGDKPMPRSDVLVDKFLLDNTERGEAIVVDRPSVVADAEHLPFRTGVFDFVFSSNLVEHLEHPELHLSEIARVGKRGCIICPTSLFEKLRGTRFHRWFVSVQNNELIFREKKCAIFDQELLEFYNSLGGLDSPCFARNLHKFQLRFAWNGAIPYKITRGEYNPEGFVHAQVDNDMPRKPKFGGLRRAYVQLSGKTIRRIFSNHRNPNLIDLIACPVCQGTINSDAAHNLLRCTSCSHQFSWSGPVPVLLKEKAVE